MGSWSIKEDTLELSPALRRVGLGRVTMLSSLGNERLPDCQNRRNCPCFGPGSQELSFIHSTSISASAKTRDAHELQRVEGMKGLLGNLYLSNLYRGGL